MYEICEMYDARMPAPPANLKFHFWPKFQIDSSTGLAPVVLPGLISVAAVRHAAPPSRAGVGTVQEQPAAARVFALTDRTVRIRSKKISC